MNQYLICNRNEILRKILNTNDNKYIVKDLIESILNIKIKNIKINDYIEENKYCVKAKKNCGIVDARIKTEKNEEINVGIIFLDRNAHTK